MNNSTESKHLSKSAKRKRNKLLKAAAAAAAINSNPTPEIQTTCNLIQQSSNNTTTQSNVDITLYTKVIETACLKSVETITPSSVLDVTSEETSENHSEIEEVLPSTTIETPTLNTTPTVSCRSYSGTRIVSHYKDQPIMSSVRQQNEFIRNPAAILPKSNDNSTKKDTIETKPVESTPLTSKTDNVITNNQLTFTPIVTTTPSLETPTNLKRCLFVDDITTKKSRKKRKHMETIDSQVVIVMDGYPEQLITKDQSIIIEKYLINQLTETIKTNLIPRFSSLNYHNGSLIVSCTNQISKEWLIEIVHKCDIINDGKLQIIDMDDMVKTTVWIPGPYENPHETLKRLMLQNPGLTTDSWIILDERINDKGREIHIQMDQGSWNKIQQLDYKPYLNFTKINFKKLE